MPELLCHPATPCTALKSVNVLTSRTPDTLTLSWSVGSNASAIALPDPAPAVRTDELWTATCFEMFARSRHGEEYREFNFSPSGAWAAYSFTGYRQGMQPLPLDQPPQIALTRTADGLTLTATLPASALPADPILAITAVIALKDGSKTYWSLQHGADKPDFHHKDGFVLPLAP